MEARTMMQNKIVTRTPFKKRLVLICDSKRVDLYSNGLDVSVKEAILVSAYHSMDDASSFIAKDFADLVIMCIKSFGAHEAEFIRLAKRINSKVEFLIIADSELHNISDVLSTGISGIVMSNAGIVSIVQAVQDIFQGGSYLSPAVARLLVESYWINQYSPLTIRETQVLKLITEGKSYTEIAERLTISSETSKSHIRNIYKKLNVNSKSEVVSRAINDRLVPV